MYSHNKKIGVYGIFNTTTQKWYVGSSVDIDLRIWQHFNLLKKGKHYNYRIQQAFNEIGAKGFEVKILEECMEEERIELEKIWMDRLSSISNGYNIRIADSSTMAEESKIKISASMLGVNTWTKGVKRSREDVERIKASRKANGKKYSAETIEKYRISKRGANNPMQKIPLDVARNIKQRYESGTTSLGKLAREHNVSRSCIQRIKNGEIYGL